MEGIHAVASIVDVEPRTFSQKVDESLADRVIILDYQYRSSPHAGWISGKIGTTMAAKKQNGEEKPPRSTQKLNVWLTAEQIAWLKKDPDGPSAAVRALITEAVGLENLAKSVKTKKKK